MGDKEKRTAVHRLFKSLAGFPRMDTSTVDAPAEQPGQAQQQQQQQQQSAAGEQPSEVQQAAEPQQGQQQQQQQQQQSAVKPQCIQVALAGASGGRGGGRGQKRKRRDDSGWPGGSLRYSKFVLYKENMDTQQAISSLAKLLRVSHKLFAVAGTKDKRGVTVQQVTAFRLDPARLAGLNPRLRGMRLGNFGFTGDQLRLGDLRGNRFELVLRGIEAGGAEAVADAAESLRDRGFINYYGLQRFGTGAVPTHRIGQALLRGQWREAVRMLLTPRADCPRDDQVEAARLYLEQGDAAGALARMPRFLVAEPALLQGLKQEPNNFLNALMLVPRNLRTMYVHAYQSYLWNAAATHRIQAFGAEAAVEGDLVLPRNEAARAAGRNRGARQRPAAAVAAADGDGGGSEDAAAAAVGEAEAAMEDAEEAAEEGAPHIVTAEEAAAGTFSIDDVVLPLPGGESRYPAHATAEVYRRLAAADAVSLDSAAHGASDFSLVSLPGAYRHVLHRPMDLEFSLLRYADPNADLAATDLMALEGRALAPPPSDGPLLGLRLAFTLPASCYATMLIRELTKQPTSVAHHKGLTQAAAGPGAEAEQQARGEEQQAVRQS